MTAIWTDALLDSGWSTDPALLHEGPGLAQLGVWALVLDATEDPDLEPSERGWVWGVMGVGTALAPTRETARQRAQQAAAVRMLIAGARS